MRRLIGAIAATVLLAVLAGCGSDSGDDAPETTLNVFAAASLTASFTEIGEAFEAEHEGVTVVFNFAGSSDLVAQIDSGAPADVFASADENNMAKATDADLVDGEPQLFATNTLQIVTEPGNPKGIASLADLADDALTVVVCAPEVPCGAATAKVETAAGIDIAPASEESNVTDVLNKVVNGEADAGLVYVTDAKNAGDKVAAVDFPEAAEAVNRYPIAVMAASQSTTVARQFVDFVLSSDGRAVLAEYGFLEP